MASKRNDPFHKEIIEEIAQEEGMDKRVVDVAATSLFLFISRVMRDVTDLKSIMVRYLGKFAIRKASKKIKLQEELQPS